VENRQQITACTVDTQHYKCFDRLSNEQRKMLDDNSVVIKYKKGGVICKQGAFASNILLVEQGMAKVFIENSCSTLVLKIIPEGNFIGLATVSDENPLYHYSAATYVESVIRQIDLQVFRNLLNLNPAFAMEIIDILSANSIQIYGRFFCLTQKHAYGRLADIILCLSERVFKSSEFHLPLSRKDLADLTGMSPETLIRILSKFIEENLIALNNKTLIVLDQERLRQISDKG